MLRSLLYAHFAESLSGLPTIRSYGEVNRFLRDNEYYVDLEDRAAFLTVTNQRYASPAPYLSDILKDLHICRWLAIRLDFLGGIMTFIVSFSQYGTSPECSIFRRSQSLLCRMHLESTRRRSVLC